MKTWLKLLLASLAVLSGGAHAEGVLNSFSTIDIYAPAARVWDVVKDYDGVEIWHPVFSDDVLKSGNNNEVGAIRTLTIKDGPSFDEELLEWDATARRFTYRVIDPNPLPILKYSATLQVSELAPGVSTIVWRSAYLNNSNGEMGDVEMIEFINGVYRAGLEAVKKSLE